ncbi:MAG TPA: hypothetical protein PLI96_08770 [Halothiobacillus sp.]|nr:hypothetical protein [Halothiobacillus sp.]
MPNSLIRLIVWMSLMSLGISPVSAGSPTTVNPSMSGIVGSAFPSLQIRDQHDTPITLPSATSVIVFTDTKAVDEWADPVLTALGQQQMSTDHLVYLSDIHRMPWLISKMIALPALRERPYSVALIREAPESPVLAEPEKGCLSWIQLQSGKVVSLTPVCTPTDLKARLDALSVRNK